MSSVRPTIRAVVATTLAGATLALTASPASAAVAEADLYATPVDTPVTDNVLANDTIVGVPTVSLVSGPATGVLVLNPDGSFTYTPAAGDETDVAFTYSVTDDAGTDQATARIIVGAEDNVAPDAVDDTYNAEQDVMLTVPAPGVLTNDSDLNGDALTVVPGTIVSVEGGTVVIAEDGSFTYTGLPGVSGTDSFSYTVTDGTLTDAALVTVNVAAANTAPVVDDSLVNVIAEDTALTGTVTATDAEGDVLTYAVLTEPTNGALILNPDGTFTYTPIENFTGTDSFVVQACDPSGMCDDGTYAVEVTAVNDAPVATDSATLVTEEGAALTGTVVVEDSDSTVFTYTEATAPTNGTLVVNPDGTFTYTPNTNFVGTDTFAIEVCDDALACDLAEYTVTVEEAAAEPVVNAEPVADDLVIVTDENTAVDGQISATDADDTALTYTVTTDAANGTVILDEATGEFTYTPEADFVGEDTFEITVCDDAATPACDTAMVTVTVNAEAVVTGPSAVVTEPVQVVEEGDLVTIDATDSMAGDNADLTYTFEQLSGPAEVVLDVNGGIATFTPTVPGEYAFSVEVCDANGMCDEQLVTVTVLAAEVPVVVTPPPVVPPAVTPIVTPVPVVPAPAPIAAAPVAQQSNRGSLAETGASSMTLAGGGLLMLLAGAAFVLYGRRNGESI